MIPRGLLLQIVLTTSLLCSEIRGWSLADRLSGRVAPRKIQTRRHATRNPTSQSTKENQQEMLSFMDQPMETTVGDAPQEQEQGDDDELVNLVKCIVKAADGRKAEDIVALRVDHVSTLTSVLVILSGNSRPQNQAIAAAITKDVEELYGLRPGGNGVPEGTADSGWMLLDYGVCMVHVMTPKSRLYYNVEGQWKDKGGKEMDISDVLVPNKMEQEEANVLGGNGFVAEEDDPFWS